MSENVKECFITGKAVIPLAPFSSSGTANIVNSIFEKTGRVLIPARFDKHEYQSTYGIR